MTRSPFLKTYLALGVLAGLGAYIYFVESKREDRADKPKEKVLSFDKAKVEELAMAAAGEPEVRLQAAKKGGGWRLSTPFAAPADQGEVDSVLSSLENLELDEVVADSPGDLAQFGLASPRSTVSVRVQGASEPLKLLVGDKTPDGGSLYAKLPTQPRVFTLPAYLETSFTKKPFDLRDRSVLHVKRDAVKTLEATGPEGSYALARDDKGEWSFTGPVATRAGRWSVDGLLGTLEGLRMESIAAEEAQDLKAFGLDKPVRTVTLGLGEGGRKRLEIGSRAGENKHHAREAGSRLVAVIPGAVVDDLAKGMNELRAKRLLDVATYEVQGIEVETAGTRRLYTRSSEKDKEGLDIYKWKRTAPEAKDLETTKVQDALFLIGGLEVQEFIDAPDGPEAYGLDKPAFKATLKYDQAGKPPAWFEIGQKEGALYARRAGDNAVLKLDAAKGGELLKAFSEL